MDVLTAPPRTIAAPFGARETAEEGVGLDRRGRARRARRCAIAGAAAEVPGASARASAPEDRTNEDMLCRGVCAKVLQRIR